MNNPNMSADLNDVATARKFTPRYRTTRSALLIIGMVAVSMQLVRAAPLVDLATSDFSLRSVASVLSQKQDADSLAAAGLIERPFDQPRAQALLERALQIAPARPDLLWLAIQVCDTAPTCDATALETRLADAAPGNGEVYLHQMQRAKRDGNDALIQQALSGFALADHVDTYWTTLNARLTRAIIAGSATPPATALVTTIGYMAAMQLSGVTVLMASCKNIANEPIAQERCRASAVVLQHGDKILLENIGVSLGLRTWPSDSAKHRALENKRKENESLISAGAKYLELQFTPRGIEKYITLMSENRREQDVFALWNDYARKQQIDFARHRREARSAHPAARKSL